MKNRVFSCLITLLFLVFSTSLYGETRFGLELSDHVLSQKNIYDTDSLNDFSKDEINNTVIVSPYLEYTPLKKISAFVMADLSWEHAFETDEDEGDADLTSAFVCYQGSPAIVYAGVQPFSIGRGFIFNDNTPGLSLDKTLSNTTQVNVKAAHVKGSSTLYSFNLGFEPGLFEKVEMFGAIYHDSNDTTASLLDAFYVWKTLWTTRIIPLTSSRGDLYYAGLGADIFVGDFFVKATGVVQKGTLTFTTENPEISRDVDFSSYLADVEISRNLSDRWSMSGIFFLRTGGRSESDKLENHTFVTPRPMSYRTQIFSNDQFGPYQNESGFYSQGIVMPGLIAPALSLTWTPRENLMFKTTTSLLYPYSEPGDGASFYGWEWDMSLSYTIGKHWQFIGEAGYFKHGDVFKDEQGQTPEPISRFLTGIHVSF